MSIYYIYIYILPVSRNKPACMWDKFNSVFMANINSSVLFGSARCFQRKTLQKEKYNTPLSFLTILIFTCPTCLSVWTKKE